MKTESPKFGSPDWRAARKAEMQRMAGWSRYRRPALVRNSRLAELQAELGRLTVRVATFGDKTLPDGTSIDQRIFELQEQIRAEWQRAIPAYASHAATAASARVPGEDDE